MSTPESDWDRLLSDLAETDGKIAVVATGGGSGAIARCYRRAGASKNFVEAVIPYSKNALRDYLDGHQIDASVSSTTVRMLASVAQRRARRLSDDDGSTATGIALTAALPTTNPRRGDDRIHVALCTDSSGVEWSLQLERDKFSRSLAETIAEDMIFLALAELIAKPTNEHQVTAESLATHGLMPAKEPFAP